jgi:asparagine synthase (glutamine-hydrolysing)
MCGIAGVLYADTERPVDRRVLEAMGASLAHRGPDAEGFWSGPGIGLVHRRLAIIDLAGGDQPIGNEDGSVQVVFNGEIYNYRALREALEARGHRFRTHSDTEVLVHLYEDEGAGFVERLRGMFAFALWDASCRRLVLARDRLGIKPLYVYRDGEALLFGSELKTLLAHPGVERRLDGDALEDYLAFGMVPGSRSIFQGVEKLPPAHVLVASARRLDARPRRYWQLRFDPDRRRRPDEWCEAIRAKLDEVVRLHLIADVPVGAFLSGGIDSGAVVALASGASSEPIRTFSIGFREEAFSELPLARQVARQYGTVHTEEIVTPDAAGLLEELASYYDEPFADPSAIPTFLVARLAAREVKVVLSGDGGDEAFGGYARYAHDLREAAVRAWLPATLRRSILGPLASRWPGLDWLPRPFRLRTTLTNLALEPDRAYANTLSLCRPPLRRRLLHPDIASGRNGHDPEDPVRRAFGTAPRGEFLGGMIAADVATVLPDDFLVKVDRATMAHGLEARPPLLDHELLELATTIPSEWKVRRAQTKWILKQTVADLLPPAVLRQPKHGFDIPIDAWLRGPLRGALEYALLDRGARVGQLVDQDTTRALLRAHQTGTGRHGRILWSLLVLSHWAERYLDPASIPDRNH